MGGVLVICPKCGETMWGSGTFGFVWHCECGEHVPGTEEEQKALEDWLRHREILFRKFSLEALT